MKIDERSPNSPNRQYKVGTALRESVNSNSSSDGKKKRITITEAGITITEAGLTSSDEAKVSSSSKM